MKVFISYSWKNKKEADELDDFLEKKGIILKRDTRDMTYKSDIVEFMKEIKEADFVITLISNSYLKSKNCIFEVLQLISDDNYKDRILPIVIDGTDIYGTSNLIRYVKHWEDEFETLKREMKGIKVENSSEIAGELKIYAAISSSIGTFIKELQRMLLRRYSKAKENDFKDLLEQIEEFDKGRVNGRFMDTHKEVIEGTKFKTEVKGDVEKIVNIDKIDTGGGDLNI